MTDETTETKPAAAVMAPEDFIAPDEPGSMMMMIGIGLIWIAVVLLIVAVFMPTSVDVPGYAPVTNLARQQMQMLLAMLGSTGFIGGILLRGFGGVLAEMARHRP